MNEANKKLEKLYKLTLIEEQRRLTENEVKTYLEIVDYCSLNKIEIDFAINI